MVKRKILLNPGPATTSETVKKAQVVPDICPREKEFTELINYVRLNLLKVVGANPEKYSCVLFGGSGTLGVESVISSLIPDNGKLLIINNGAYGERQKQIVEAYSIPYFEWKLSSMEVPDLAELEKIIDNNQFTHLSFVHHETTTGLLNPFEKIIGLAKSKGLDVIVDTVSSFAGIHINLERVDADFIVSTSNKCIQGMPGIAFVIGKKLKIEQSKFVTKRALYVNLYDQYCHLNEKGQFRFTPPVQTLYALKQAIIEFFEEGGIDGRRLRYIENWRTLMDGVKKLNLENLIPEENHSKILISVKCPLLNFDFNKLHDDLYKKDFTIYPGKLSDYNTFRLSVLGDITKDDIKSFLDQLKISLREIDDENSIN